MKFHVILLAFLCTLGLSTPASHVANQPRVAASLLEHTAPHHALPAYLRPRQPGAWTVEDRLAHHRLVKRLVAEVDNNPRKNLSPALHKFKNFIEETPRVYMYFQQMFEQIPWRAAYWLDPVGNPTIRDYQHFLQVLNHIVTTAPEWPLTEKGFVAVGVPMIVIFDWPMGTTSGYAAFLDPEVNKMLKLVLNEWGKFLQSPSSTQVLTRADNGWFGEVGLSFLEAIGNFPTNSSRKFCEIYDCDDTVDHFGFSSWDAFFTRRFQHGVRPLASPRNHNVIAAPCEAGVFNIQKGVSLRDQFFVKGQPYSVLDMLANDRLSHKFTGGTIYQGFLNSLSYHRWHAPVSGVVRRAFVVDGTYFSMPLFQGLGDRNTTEINVFGFGQSQGYLSAMATRAVILIEADNTAIGTVGFIAIGMDEVSTCEIGVIEGQHVRKGDEMGMFHFGGSSHCLLFEPKAELNGLPRLDKKGNVPVRSQLAVVKQNAGR